MQTLLLLNVSEDKTLYDWHEYMDKLEVFGEKLSTKSSYLLKFKGHQNETSLRIRSRFFKQDSDEEAKYFALISQTRSNQLANSYEIWISNDRILLYDVKEASCKSFGNSLAHPLENLYFDFHHVSKMR